MLMKQITTNPIALVSFFLLLAVQSIGQFTVTITVNGGTSTTTCTDPIGAPDPQWSVNIANQGWVTYPSSLLCHTNPPNVQFNQTYNCLFEVPQTIQVCFRAFEDDASIFNPCTPVTSCNVETCMDVPVPFQGSQDFVIELPQNQPSWGLVSMTIASSGVPGGLFDAICNAYDFGTLQLGQALGDADTSMFNNYCGTSFNEPDPWWWGVPWVNNVGIWFKFTTDDSPSGQIWVNAKSDPSNLGDPVNLQVAVFTAQNNVCSGPWNFVSQNHSPIDWDEYVPINCPLPNTTYYILVDGVSDTPDQVDGYFGIEVVDMGILPAPEFLCEAEDLGAVPLGGTVSTNGPRTNRCTNNSDGLPASAFGVQKSVWFTFTPPPTGHVIIEGISLPSDPIGIQLGLYLSSTDDCTGVYTEVYSQYTANSVNETIQIKCLNPNRTYYIMVDGAVSDLNVGDFTLSVTDAGDVTPKTFLSPVLCAGSTFSVGSNVYAQSGIYYDTLSLPNGCDSIVITDLTIHDPLLLDISILNQGIGLGNTSGSALVLPTGGAGTYTYTWSDGQTSATAANLAGGDIFCVTVSDLVGCSADTCFEMPYFIHFVPDAAADPLLCHGDQNGVIRVTAVGGVPPYQFSWQNAANTLNGTGTVPADGQMVAISNLPAGEYFFQMQDVLFDTAFTVVINQPPPIAVGSAAVNDASCNGFCDGEIQVETIGGTGTLQLAWSGGSVGQTIGNLCAGNYPLTVTDGNGCTATFDFNVGQPVAFLASAAQVQAVSCFMGSDGSATVTTNGQPVAYLWNNGSTEQTISNLSGGNYEVTVTNLDGCSATAVVTVATPSAPVSVNIVQDNPVICHGDQNAVLRAVAAGPGNQFTYAWSEGGNGAVAAQLGAGSYTVTVTNENGCSATSTFSVAQPSEIFADFATNALTCLDPLDAGTVTILGVSGGIEPFVFSSNGLAFSTDPVLDGYTAGQQRFFVKDGGGCVREFYATIDGPQELLLELDEDRVIDLGETIKLNAFVSQLGVTYQWSPAEFLSCTDCPSPLATPIKGQRFTLVVTDAFGCTASASTFIEVLKKRKVYVPNAFSPNGDGFNDDFAPFGGSDVLIIREFMVFDRQGNQVFAAANIQPGESGRGWDGTFKGKIMQPAVFTWFAKVEFIDGEVEIFRGDVTLMR